MSTFIFLQVPLSVGLTMAPPTTFNTVIWQWLNQTYYSGLNYGNRNATNVVSTVNIAMSYTAATVSSVAIAIVLRRFIIGNYALRMKSGNQILFNSATSFAALAGAAVTNAIVMRSQELQKGITIYDELNNPAGKSKRAAW
jgi:peptidyl-tRNA hydrolase